MNIRTIITVILVLVIAIVGYLAYSRGSHFAAGENGSATTTETASDMQSTTSSAASKINNFVSIRFKDNGEDASTGANSTSVYVTVAGKEYNAGTYQGTCYRIGTDTTDPLLDGEILGMQCYFAGGGDEIGIFTENNSYVVKKGEIQEPQGDGTPAFRGNFKTIFTVPPSIVPLIRPQSK